MVIKIVVIRWVRDQHRQRLVVCWPAAVVLLGFACDAPFYFLFSAELCIKPCCHDVLPQLYMGTTVLLYISQRDIDRHLNITPQPM